MTDNYSVFTCAECGNKYPVGGSTLKSPVESSPESAEHHDLDCSVYEALKQRGQTSDRDAHQSLGADVEGSE